MFGNAHYVEGSTGQGAYYGFIRVGRPAHRQDIPGERPVGCSYCDVPPTESGCFDQEEAQTCRRNIAG